MFNPLNTWMTDIHQSEMVNSALKRFPRGVSPTRNGFLEHIVLELGGMLVETGKRIQSRYAAPIQADLDA